MKNLPLFGQAVGHNILLLPVAAAMLMWALLAFVRGDRPANYMTVSSVWLWIALLGAFARHVLRAHNERIRELEEELARMKNAASGR